MCKMLNTNDNENVLVVLYYADENGLANRFLFKKFFFIVAYNLVQIYNFVEF